MSSFGVNNLRDSLGRLRGKPIELNVISDDKVPCVETSSEELLCRNPTVSVWMITYNHEPYIRQAIESVMMQKTDFEYELVIGEDCSTDRTREICFEYQKMYPDKIRVLWWHENVSKCGGNGSRVFSRCRGDFIALCEGDDCWTDPHKLQSQVDVMRANPNVGLCFASGVVNHVSCGTKEPWHDENVYQEGLQESSAFFTRECAGFKRNRKWCYPFLLTASTLIRQSIFQEAQRRYDIFGWQLLLGDLIWWLSVSSLSDAWYIKSRMSQYNMTSTGATGHSNGRLMRDGMLVRLYFWIKSGKSLRDLPKDFRKFVALKVLENSPDCKWPDWIPPPRMSEYGAFFAWLAMRKHLAGGCLNKWLRRAVVYL